MKVDFNFKNLFKIKIGKVYDVTEFAQSHPGGKANIMLAVGGDLGFLFDYLMSLIVILMTI